MDHIVTEADFYHSLIRDIFEAIASLFDDGAAIDPVTVRDRLAPKDFNKRETDEYILEVLKGTPTAANVIPYAKIVRAKAILRAAQQAAADAVRLAAERGATLQDV